jgi:hypothetical protein
MYANGCIKESIRIVDARKGLIALSSRATKEKTNLLVVEIAKQNNCKYYANLIDRE